MFLCCKSMRYLPTGDTGLQPSSAAVEWMVNS